MRVAATGKCAGTRNDVTITGNAAALSTMKIYTYKHGDVLVEKLFPSGMWLVQLRDAAGELKDKIRCDNYRSAMEYKRAFIAIAKQ